MLPRRIQEVFREGRREDSARCVKQCLFCRKRVVFQVVSAKPLETSWSTDPPGTHLTTFCYAESVHRDCVPVAQPVPTQWRARNYRPQFFYLLVQLGTSVSFGTLKFSGLWIIETSLAIIETLFFIIVFRFFILILIRYTRSLIILLLLSLYMLYKLYY